MNSINETDKKRRNSLIDEDIKRIDEALNSSDYSFVKETHVYIDAKYQACIYGWHLGMYDYILDSGFDLQFTSIDSLKENLLMMKPKLIAFKEGWNAYASETDSTSGVNVVVNNNVNIDISFQEARQKIEDMPGLTNEETKDIQDKLDELELISKETITKKQKWEKIKPILKYALDKSVDVAIAFMVLIVQMKLGA